MATRRPSGRGSRQSGFRRHHEVFKGVRWRRPNRLWHETNKRRDPRFSAACKLDWSHILKRPDIRYDDGRQLALAARNLGIFRQVYFVVYVKKTGFLHIISIRYATDDEEHAFLTAYP